MRLNREACEYARWTTTNQSGDVEVSFDAGSTWVAAETVAGGFRVLVAGPDCDDPGSAEILTERTTHVTCRMVDDPELVVRRAGTITLG